MGKIKKSFLSNIVLIISIVVFKILGKQILYINYWEYTNLMITAFLILWLSISASLIITNKPILQNIFHEVKGRELGLTLMLCSIFFIFLYGYNNMNKNITTVYGQDFHKLKNIKKNYKEYKYDINLKLEEMKINEVYKTLDSEKRGKITYYYDLSSSKESIDIINDTIEEMHSKINNILNLDNEIEGKIAILMTLEKLGVKDRDAEAYVNLLNNIVNIKSLYAYKTYSSMYIYDYEEYNNLTEDRILKDYKSIVIHEYTHKLTNDLIDKNQGNRLDFPIWFFEGIAVYSQKVCLNEPFNYTLKEKIDLKDNSGFKSSNPEDYYEASGQAVNELISNFGEDIILKIISDTKKTQNFYKSFQNITDKTFEDFLKQSELNMENKEIN